MYIGYAKATGSVVLVILAIVACIVGQAARNGTPVAPFVVVRMRSDNYLCLRVYPRCV